MKTILINIAIIVGAFFIWCANHCLEERELNKINQKIKEEKRYHAEFVNAKRTGSNAKGKPENSR